MVHMRDYSTRFFVLSSASLVSVINTISLPTFTAIDVARASFNGTLEGVNDLRMGPWSFCLFFANQSVNPCNAVSPCNLSVINDHHACDSRQYGYDVSILSPSHGLELVTIGRSWTRGLATHAAATAAISLTFLSLILRKTIPYLGLITFLITLIAFLSDIAFFFHIRAILSTVQVDGVTTIANTGPGLWMSLVIFCLVVAESSASEGDIRLQRLKDRIFNGNMDFLVSNEINAGGAVRPTAVIESVLTYECSLCWECRAELYAVPCRETHIFCKRCIEAHLKRKDRCPHCTNCLPIYEEDLRTVKIIPSYSD